jgi:hypothetical protein
MTSPILIQKFKIDTFKIEKDLLLDFRRKSITHFVGQTIFKKQLDIYFYSDAIGAQMEAIDKINMPNTCDFKIENSWDTYQMLINKK